MQRVTDLETEPEVGRFYLVPCVLYKGDWTPIMGPLHEDRELIGFQEEHYHRDVRFHSDAEVEWLTPQIYNPLIEPKAEGYALLTVLITEYIGSGVEYKRRKCRRRMPDFPVEKRYQHNPLHVARAPWLPRLEEAYMDASAKGGRCPHRGFILKGLPEKEGRVICPGHGLAWDVRTGALVRRCPRTS